MEFEKQEQEKQSSDKHNSFRSWLQGEFLQRVQKNSRYSIRAFAQNLGMDPSSVSQILSGKRNVSIKVITKIGSKLCIPPAQLADFLENTTRQKNGLSTTKEECYSILTQDIFSYISNWYYCAILELSFVEAFKFDARWISNSLGITKLEAEIAMEKLVRLDLLVVDDKGQIVKKDKFITSMKHPLDTSTYHKQLQRQVLELGLEAIANCPQEEKDISSMTMAIDPDKLPEAIEKITVFRRELCKFLETGNQTQVYNLGIQIFPLSKLQDEENQ